ncbi:hypothetical protein CAEBREN_10783 [Caenorhabditis brenneri]|uniref:Uncharacterized protein n=1 Tax=Caenorhabditis brenneri TaxID=135651 RepID=G0NX14_CAEBE|nr:hypothetical protein CAEBREN_10783 [Caenorhabditis brenneri]
MPYYLTKKKSSSWRIKEIKEETKLSVPLTNISFIPGLAHCEHQNKRGAGFYCLKRSSMDQATKDKLFLKSLELHRIQKAPEPAPNLSTASPSS